MPNDQLHRLLSGSLRKSWGGASVVEGPAGLMMPESLARTVEEMEKGLPKGCTYRRRAKASSDFRIEDGERSDVSFITTDAVDRDREVVLPRGIKLKDYNHVVTFAHKYDQLPVGSCLWIKPQETQKGSGMVAKTNYPTKPADWGNAPWLPSAILHLMQQEVPTCTGKSIGFIPLEMREPTRKELDACPEWDGATIISKCTLLEYAVAPVPCNQDAEMEAVSKGIGGEIAELVISAMKSMAGEPYTPPITIDGYMTAKTYTAAMVQAKKQLMDEIGRMTHTEAMSALHRLLGVA